MQAKCIKLGLSDHCQFESSVLTNRYFSAMDSAIGDIVYELMVNEMFDNTVIVFMSDNGGQALSSGASNFPYRGNKGTYYEAGT